MASLSAWPTDTLRLCPHSRTYVQIIQSSIFAKITDQTTAAQFAEAEQSLLTLCERLERQVDWTHYPALTGTHACVRDVYTLASSLLANLFIMQSEPPTPPAPPAHRQLQRSADEVVNDVSSLADQVNRPGDTYLGEKRQGGTTPVGSR